MKCKSRVQIALPWAVGPMNQMRYKFFPGGDSVMPGPIAGAVSIHEQESINAIV